MIPGSLALISCDAYGVQVVFLARQFSSVLCYSQFVCVYFSQCACVLWTCSMAMKCYGKMWIIDAVCMLLGHSWSPLFIWHCWHSLNHINIKCPLGQSLV
jgi:hypothetical protein